MDDAEADPKPRYRPRRFEHDEGDAPASSWFPGPDRRAAEQQVAWRRLMSHEDADRLVGAAIEWLRGKWGEERPCPYCGDPTWEVGAPFELLRPSTERMSLVFPITCVNCGATTLLDAERAGLA
jgi:hypothetical protein